MRSRNATSLLLLASLWLFACGASAFAQGSNSDRCTVGLLDMTGKKADDADKAKGKELGTFDTVVGEEELTTKAYPLPKTNLFVVASVWYTDESMRSEKGSDSISLELMVSPTQKRDVLGSLTFSDAEMPLNGFDVGRVTTMFKHGRQTFMLIMECRKPAR